MSSENYEAVWKLILNTPDFKDPIALALSIMKSLEELVGMKNDTDSSLYIDKLDKKVADLKSPEESPDRDNLFHLLQKIDNVMDKIKHKIKTDDVWIKMCDNETKGVLQRM